MSIEGANELFTLIDSQVMSGNITGDAQAILNGKGYTFEFHWRAGSTPIGTVSIEGSNSYNLPGITAHWETIPGCSKALPGSGNGADEDSIILDILRIGAKWVRPIYTRTSGSGTLSCFMQQKDK